MCVLSHAVIHVVHLNMWTTCRATGGDEHALFSFMFDLLCSMIVLHFHTQVSQYKVNKDGRISLPFQFVVSPWESATFAMCVSGCVCFAEGKDGEKRKNYAEKNGQNWGPHSGGNVYITQLIWRNASERRHLDWVGWIGLSVLFINGL